MVRAPLVHGARELKTRKLRTLELSARFDDELRALLVANASTLEGLAVQGGFSPADLPPLPGLRGRRQLAMIQNGNGSDFSLWLLQASGKWVEVAGFDNGVIAAGFGRDEALWLLSKKDAPRRRVLRLPLKTPQLAKAKVVIDQRAGVIEQIMPTQSRIYLRDAQCAPADPNASSQAASDCPARRADRRAGLRPGRILIR